MARTVQYMLQKYGDTDRTVCHEVPENVHLHLYQEGMDLTLISQWLGHSQLEAKLNPQRCTVIDKEILKRLACVDSIFIENFLMTLLTKCVSSVHKKISDKNG